jgi:hypothetical protein
MRANRQLRVNKLKFGRLIAEFLREAKLIDSPNVIKQSRLVFAGKHYVVLVLY